MVKDLDIRSLGFREAWNFFKTEIDLKAEEYKQTRFGVNLNFDINEYLNGNIHEITNWDRDWETKS